MNIQDYKSIVEETAIFPEKVDNFGLAYAWLGLIDEVIEVSDVEEGDTVNIIKELGDCCWYVSAICKQLDLDQSKVFDIEGTESTDLRASNTLFSFTGKIKKFYRDGKEIDKEEITIVLNNFLNLLFVTVNFMTQDTITMDEVLTTNFNKLMSRKQRGVLQGSGDNR